MGWLFQSQGAAGQPPSFLHLRSTAARLMENYVFLNGAQRNSRESAWAGKQPPRGRSRSRRPPSLLGRDVTGILLVKVVGDRELIGIPVGFDFGVADGAGEPASAGARIRQRWPWWTSGSRHRGSGEGCINERDFLGHNPVPVWLADINGDKVRQGFGHRRYLETHGMTLVI